MPTNSPTTEPMTIAAAETSTVVSSPSASCHAHVPELGRGSAPSPPQNFGKRRSSRRRPAAMIRRGGDIEHACRHPRLDDAEAVDVDAARLEGEFGHGDRRGDGGVLEQRDEGRAERRQRVAQHDRKADQPRHLQARQADRQAGVDQARKVCRSGWRGTLRSDRRRHRAPARRRSSRACPGGCRVRAARNRRRARSPAAACCGRR